MNFSKRFRVTKSPAVSFTTDTCLCNLNDDCLLEIFSLQSLDLIDLCALAETCTRFRRLTERIIPKTIAIHKFHPERYVVDLMNRREIKRYDVRRIIEHFGSILSEVRITGDCYTSCHDEHFLLHLVTRYCLHNLKSLAIHWMKVPDEYKDKLRSIFKRLQKLDLTGVCLSLEKDMFSGMNSLVELSVHFMVNDKAILETTFPKLESFDFQKRKFAVADSTRVPFEDQHLTSLSTFIASHRNLRMPITLDCNENRKMAILNAIGNSCTELRELRLRLGHLTGETVLPLRTLSCLSVLNLSAVSFDNFELFQSLSELRQLSLFGCDLPEDCHQFAYLSQLKKLKICRWGQSFSGLDLVGIIGELTDLIEFYVSGPRETLDERAFSQIVRIVNGRSSELSLVCKRSFDMKNGDEHQKVRIVPRPYDE